MSKPIGGASGPAATTSMASDDTFVIWRDANGDVRTITKANALGFTATGGGTLATGGFTLTVPATGTVSLLGTAQTFTALKTFGSGLTFGQDTLNYYDEGTWTPADASGAGLTFSSVTGTYTRIGRMVFCQFRVIYPTTANGTAAEIGGLPFTPAAPDGLTGNLMGGQVLSDPNSSGARAVDVSASNSSIRVLSAALANITNATMSGKQIRGHFSYFV